jgi:hypothetical protein
MKTSTILTLALFLGPLAHARVPDTAHLGANLSAALAGDEQALIASRRQLGRIPGLEYVGRLNAFEFRRAARDIEVASSQDSCWVDVTFKDRSGQTIRWQAESSNPDKDICYFKNNFGQYGHVKATVTYPAPGASR